MKWQKMKQKNAQTLIEYAMVAAIVVSATIAMSTYVFRSVQGTQQSIQKEFGEQSSSKDACDLYPDSPQCKDK